MIEASQKISKETSCFYIFDLDSIEKKIADFKNAWKSFFPRFKFCYSYKTNSIPFITQLIHQNGGGAEVVSGTELKWALSDGFKGKQILFDGPVKTKDELVLACQEGVRIQLDSMEEIKILSRMKEYSPCCSIRLSVPYKKLGFSRFGFGLEDLETIFSMASQAKIPIQGLHIHIGSNINDPQKYIEALKIYKDTFKTFYTDSSIKWLDIGGGYPAESKKGSEPLISISVFAEQIFQFLNNECYLNLKNVEFITEPGRHLVEDDGFLYCQVATIKKRNHRNIAILNTGTNYVRSIQNWTHPLYRLRDDSNHSEEEIIYDLYGSNCFELDLFKQDFRCKRSLEIGEGLLIGSCGGYDIPSTNPWIRPLPPIYGIYKDTLMNLRSSQTACELGMLFGRNHQNPSRIEQSLELASHG